MYCFIPRCLKQTVLPLIGGLPEDKGWEVEWRTQVLDISGIQEGGLASSSVQLKNTLTHPMNTSKKYTSYHVTIAFRFFSSTATPICNTLGDRSDATPSGAWSVGGAASKAILALDI